MPLRIPVDHINEAMGVGSLVHVNLFGVLFVLSAVLVWYILFKKQGRTPPFLVAGLAMLTSTSLVAFIAIEHYYSLECPVAALKHKYSDVILKANVKYLLTQPIPFAIADGTALCYIRKNKELMVWDQDSDLQVEMDYTKDPNAAGLMAGLEAFYKEIGTGFEFQFLPERSLVQVKHPPSGSHGDLWLWEKVEKDGKPYLYNVDFNFNHLKPANCVPYEWFAPTTIEKWDLGGEIIDVPVHADMPKYLAAQFGPQFMEPYHSRWQCAENFVVHADKHWLVGYVALAVALGAYIAKTTLRYTSARSKGGVLPTNIFF